MRPTEKVHKYVEDKTCGHVIAVKIRAELHYIYPDDTILYRNRLKETQ
jgi:hypothetical protein